MELFLDVLGESLVDTAKMLPFLFLAYLLIEYIEHRHGERIEALLAGGGRWGAVPGAVLGCVPQCGFSAIASNFYASRVITLGTLMAVYLATSDEAIPLLVSMPAYWDKLVVLMVIKVVYAVIVGFVLDFVLRGILPKGLRGGYTGHADEVDFERDWLDDARRYLTNIVGKYGPHIQLLLKKTGGVLDQIKYICPLHGPVWRKDLGWFIEKYDTWSRYAPETQGVLIVYASMYGNTENAAQALAASLCNKGMSKVAMYDVSSTHVSQLISEAFKYSHIVLASVTYNLGIYPAMHDFLMDMKALNLQNRTFAIIENGSWAVKSGDLMQKFVNDELKNMTVLNERLSLASSMGTDKRTELEALANAILESMK